jgi:cyanophycin synthetase
VAGEPVTFGKTRGAGAEGTYHVLYQYEQEDVGLEAGRLGITLLHSLLPPELQPEGSVPGDFDFAAERDEFIRFAQRRALGPSTMSLVRAAEDRRIPWIRLNEQSLIQFGHGRFQQRIQATITSRTSHIAVELASDKEETNRILAHLGLPVPRQRLVQREDDAVAAAERIGYPVVVKPFNANHGRGISIHLTTEEQVRTAFEVAREHSRSVIVESFITGEDHRMLVVNGELVAVSKRVPGHVMGDGVHTIEQLMEEVNRDPRRGIGHEKVLTRLVLDHQAETLLAKKGYTKDTVPADGEPVFLRSTGNLSTGGTAIDKTDVIHYDNRVMAERAVKAIGLDVGGVDYIAPDISRSYQEIGGSIVEINAAPGFRMHVAPTEGKPRDVAGPVIDMLFPKGTPARIPIAAITGTNGKTTTTRMVGHILKLSGFTVGMTTSDGVYIDGVLSVKGDMTGPWASHLALRDPSVDAAVLETARGGIVRTGLGWRKCKVGAVLNVASDHLGMGGIHDLDELAEVKQVVVEVAQEFCVLNADDERVARMAEHSKATPIWVTMDHTNQRVREHIQNRGRAMVLEEGMNGRMIVLYVGDEHIPLLWARQIPATLEGHALHNVQNAMFAAAIALAMGISLDNIRNGLRTFTADFFQTPGRLNFYNEHPFRVLLDYAHNPHGMTAMARMIREMNVQGRRIGVISAPGDRRDDDIRELAHAAAPAFDLILLREDDNRRGRKPGEIGEILRQGLVAAGFPAERIAPEIFAEEAAIQRALETAQPGDLVVLFGDNLDRSWRQIVSFGKSAEVSEAVPVTPLFAPDAELPPAPKPAIPAGARSSSGSPKGDGRGAGEHDD